MECEAVWKVMVSAWGVARNVVAGEKEECGGSDGRKTRGRTEKIREQRRSRESASSSVQGRRRRKNTRRKVEVNGEEELARPDAEGLTKEGIRSKGKGIMR